MEVAEALHSLRLLPEPLLPEHFLPEHFLPEHLLPEQPLPELLPRAEMQVLPRLKQAHLEFLHPVQLVRFDLVLLLPGSRLGQL